MKKFALIVALLLTGCVPGGCAALTSSAPESWVKADRATYEAVAPAYTEYINNDQTLDQPGKDRSLRTLTTWQRRLEEHEATLAKPAQ